jgi:hypothetical protein
MMSYILLTNVCFRSGTKGDRSRIVVNQCGEAAGQVSDHNRAHFGSGHAEAVEHLSFSCNF